MIYNNAKMAMTSVKEARIRSFLTMLGVIIGVASVVLTISIGEGVKNQVVSQINQLGNNVIEIRPGSVFSPNSTQQLTKLAVANNLVGTSTLTNNDVNSLQHLAGVAGVSYSAMITGTVSTSTTANYTQATILATTPNNSQVLGQNVQYGEALGQDSVDTNAAVIGSNIASSLFGSAEPIGNEFNIKGQTFIVRGILAATPANLLNIGINFNNVIYIPIEVGESMMGESLPISELDVRVSNAKTTAQIESAINKTLLANHNGQADFTIIKQSEYLNATDQVFNVLTSFVAAIAGISLLVGGIGIMNIMLVSVSERTREIGIRKALGATNQQILSQFLVEAMFISIIGGILGIGLSVIVTFIIRFSSTINPSISLATILLATGMSTVIGIIFGMAPAIQAARKDPIEALRHE